VIVRVEVQGVNRALRPVQSEQVWKTKKAEKGRKIQNQIPPGRSGSRRGTFGIRIERTVQFSAFFCLFRLTNGSLDTGRDGLIRPQWNDCTHSPPSNYGVAMQTHLIERELVHSIVNAFHTVYNYYDFGLTEPLYCGALEYELTDRGHTVAREVAVDVDYKDRHVGWQRIDLIVDNKIVVEVKATEALPKYAKRQLLCYLRVTTCQVGLVLHFGPEPKFYRLADFRPKRALRAHRSTA
jgi:GxxExxY protein